MKYMPNTRPVLNCTSYGTSAEGQGSNLNIGKELESWIVDPKNNLSQVNEQVPGTVQFSQTGCAPSLLSLTISFLILFD